MTREDLVRHLNKYIPASASDYCADLLITHRVHLRISKPRNSKFGDFRIPKAGEQHKISVNANQNPYAFLITFVHEIAHLVVWEHHGPRVAAHGKEWKNSFRQLMQPVLNPGVFPSELLMAVADYMSDPDASSCSSPRLMKALARYDHPESGVFLDELPPGTVFRIENGMTFRKGEKKRTRFLCEEINTGRKYLVNGIHKVKPVNSGS